MNIEFLSPSYKRPQKSPTQAAYPFIKLVVAKSEAAAYKKSGNDIIVISDKVQGSASRVQNWILDYGKEKDLDCIIKADDDIDFIGRWSEQEVFKLNAEQLLEFAEMATIMAYDAGVMLWGLNPSGSTDKGAYREHTPFSFVSVILGPFVGHCRTEFRFDERFRLKADYDMALQNLFKNRRVLRFNQYHYECKQAENIGGAAMYRNTETEKAEFLLLQQKWGNKVVQKDRKSKREFDFNPIIKIPIRGV